LAIMLPVLTNGVVTLAVSMGVGAGPAALMTALVPISVVLIRVYAGDRPRALTWLGVMVGFVGLAVLLLGGHSEGGFPFWPSVIVVLSANCWALGSFLQPRIELPSDSFVTAAYELVIGGVILTVWGMLAGEDLSFDYPAKTWILLAYLMASSTIAFTTYVWLLDNAPISLVSTHAYVNPVIAVFLAWLLLSEPITWPILVGGGIVVVAVILVITEERGLRVPATPPPDALAE
jgi:drug/metabolite transporter (DMT)-like permease